MGSSRRQPRLRPEELDKQQSALYRAITEGPRATGPGAFALTDGTGALVGPFGGFLLSPSVGDAVQALGAAVRYRSALTDRIREMAILAVAGHRESQFERYAHEIIGAACGVSPEEIADLRNGVPPDLADEHERAALRLTFGLLDGDVDDDLWAACVPPLTPADVFELTTLVGYYSMLALQMRIFRVDIPPDRS